MTGNCQRDRLEALGPLAGCMEYSGPRNLDSVISYTWEPKRGGPSGTNAQAVGAVKSWLRKPLFMLRQAQHEQKKVNALNTHTVRP